MGERKDGDAASHHLRPSPGSEEPWPARSAVRRGRKDQAETVIVMAVAAVPVVAPERAWLIAGAMTAARSCGRRGVDRPARLSRHGPAARHARQDSDL
jgi:hypothetical protein